MPNSASSIVEDHSVDDPRSVAPPARDPVRVSVDLPSDVLLRVGTGWLRLLHVTAIPLLVGGTAYGLEGDVSAALFRQAWPVVGLLAAAYVAASGLHAKVDRFPFTTPIEASLLGVGLTMVPAGALLGGMAGAPVDTVGLLATGASMGWFVLIHGLPPVRDAQLRVVPGGAANRLLALPALSPKPETERDGADANCSAALDGLVADLQALPANGQEALANCSGKGLPVYPADHLYQRLTARIPLDSPFETNVEFRTISQYRAVKRAMDLLLILVSLPVTVPLIAGTALAIRLGSRGPVLFWQERVGRGGETFQMAKFRSMHVGHEGEDRAVFADEDDDRVTTVGRFIRTFRLDELPQIWNVLRGEMSLIGPRPEQVGLAEHFGDALRLYHARHLVRPGITGWAQVLHGYAADVDETRRKLEHDLYYVKHRSVFLDLLIVYLTFKTLLTGFGAR